MPLQTALSQNSLIQPPNKRKVSAVLARTVFDEYDTNHSGSIDTREFGRLCASLGYAISKEDLEFAIRLLDSDGNGSISYEECKGNNFTSNCIVFGMLTIVQSTPGGLAKNDSQHWSYLKQTKKCFEMFGRTLANSIPTNRGF